MAPWCAKCGDDEAYLIDGLFCDPCRKKLDRVEVRSPVIWIRDFQCPSCSQRHRVEAKRRDLDSVQDKVIRHCKETYRCPAERDMLKYF